MNYLLSKPDYLLASSQWKIQKNHSSFEHIVYNIVRSKELKTGFCPVKNDKKIKNGMRPFWVFEQSLWALKYLSNNVLKAKDESSRKQLINNKSSYLSLLTVEQQNKVFDYLQKLG